MAGTAALPKSDSSAFPRAAIPSWMEESSDFPSDLEAKIDEKACCAAGISCQDDLAAEKVISFSTFRKESDRIIKAKSAGAAAALSTPPAPSAPSAPAERRQEFAQIPTEKIPNVAPAQAPEKLSWAQRIAAKVSQVKSGVSSALGFSTPAKEPEKPQEKKSWFSRNLPTVAAVFPSRAQSVVAPTAAPTAPQPKPWVHSLSFGSGVTLRNASRVVITPDNPVRRFRNPFSFDVPASLSQVRPGCALARLSRMDPEEGGGIREAEETLSILRAVQSADFFLSTAADDRYESQMEAAKRATSHERIVIYGDGDSPNKALPEKIKAFKEVDKESCVPLTELIKKEGLGSFSLFKQLTTAVTKRANRLGISVQDVSQNANVEFEAWRKMSSRERLERNAKAVAAMAALLS